MWQINHERKASLMYHSRRTNYKGAVKGKLEERVLIDYWGRCLKIAEASQILVQI